MPTTAKQVLEEALAKGIPINLGGDEMMSLAATCIFFGGDKPINPSTLYRGIRKGRYPAPLHVAGRGSRWRRSECVECRDKVLVEERDKRVAERRAQQADEAA